MRAIWSGTALSSTQTDRQTGEPLIYRLVAYDDGTATCTCPSFLFGGRSAPDRLRFRCKHLQPLFTGDDFQAPTGELAAAPPVAVPPPVGPTPSSPVTRVRQQPDLFDDDDSDYRRGRIRR